MGNEGLVRREGWMIALLVNLAGLHEPIRGAEPRSNETNDRSARAGHTPSPDPKTEFRGVFFGGRSGREILQWHFQKCTEYGFAGWWIFSYQDQEVSGLRTGIRSTDGRWKTDLLEIVKQQAKGRDARSH